MIYCWAPYDIQKRSYESRQIVKEAQGKAWFYTFWIIGRIWNFAYMYIVNWYEHYYSVKIPFSPDNDLGMYFWSWLKINLTDIRPHSWWTVTNTWCQKFTSGGVVATREILSRHFEKYMQAMELKLTVYVRITNFFLYVKKTGEIPIFRTFIATFCFLPIFVKNRNFPVGGTLWRHNFATPRPIFMILVCMDRGDL